MTTNGDNWLEIGTIVASQGRKGELRVSSASDFPERFENPGKRWLQSPNGEQIQEVELLSGRDIPGKNIYIVQLSGIENREQAEDLRGYKLLVSKNDRPQLAADEYHVADLLDLEVYHQLTGEIIGTVVDIFWAGNDVLEVELHQQPLLQEKSSPDPSKINRISKQRKLKPKPPKTATVLIPFVKEIVPIVDLDRKRLEINPPSGLLNL